jgi:hypothetical protein
MARMLMVFLLVFGCVSTMLVLPAPVSSVAAINSHFTKSPYAGQYSGPYTALSPKFGDQVGKLTLSIDPDGKVTGRSENATSGRSADITGVVSEEGDAQLVLQWPNLTFQIRGTVTKTKKGRLKGTLNQFQGKTFIASIDLDLPPA